MKIYYRGTNPKSKKRIKTGENKWDNNLFCSLEEKYARAYGSEIEIIVPKKTARILKEGTKKFKKIFGERKTNQNLLDWCVSGKIIAEKNYDIIEFKRQGDIGTIIMNEDAVIRNYNYSEN